MGSPWNQHCANCIGTLSFPIADLFVTTVTTVWLISAAMAVLLRSRPTVYKLPDIDGVAALNHINELGLVSRSRAETIADRLISLPPRTLGIPDNSVFVRRRHLSVNNSPLR